MGQSGLGYCLKVFLTNKISIMANVSLHDLLKSFNSSFLHKITIKVIEIMLLDKPVILLFP